MKIKEVGEFSGISEIYFQKFQPFSLCQGGKNFKAFTCKYVFNAFKSCIWDLSIKYTIQYNEYPEPFCIEYGQYYFG